MPDIESSALGFLDTNLVFESPSEKESFIKQTSQHSNHECWLEIAGLLYTGIKGPANKISAIAIWKQLANLDYADAHGPLGELLIRGDDLPLDLKSGIFHLDRAARLGRIGSARTLISIFKFGFEGLAADHEKALEYTKLAAELGDIEQMLNLSIQLSEAPYFDSASAFHYANLAAMAEDPRGHYNVGLNNQHFEATKHVIARVDPYVSYEESTKLAGAFNKLYPNLDLHCGFALTAMQLEGLILKDVLLRGVRAGILALPIHDAVAVEFDHQDWAKDAMEDVWQSVMSEFHKTARTSVNIKFTS